MKICFVRQNIKTMTHSQIITKINDLLKLGGSHYFNVEGEDGEVIKIRCSDHSANRLNNHEKTLSFISKFCNQGYRKMINEWVIQENGLTDTYQTIEEVLEWENVASI